ncbi:MAG: phosphatidate cytidylyltransferase [bacterium]|nr:phosphatidate cytidylyltransferase [bacterium]
MKRVVSAVILGGAFVALLLAAPRAPGAAGVAVAVLIAAHEMAALLERAGASLPRVPAVAAGSLVLAGAWAAGVAGMSAGLAVGLGIIFASEVLTGTSKGSVTRVSGGFLLILLPVWSLAHLILYLESETTRRSLLFLLLCVWVCDSAAFYVGSTMGKHKLAPGISPNKTVEGSVAGVLGSVAAALLMRAVSLVTWPVAFVLFAGAVIAVLAQLGDLAESMIKRDAGVKDSGNLIPGHGGVLDRVDALLFTVPVFYYALLLLRGLGGGG